MIKSIESTDELTELFWDSCIKSKFPICFKVFLEVVIETRLLEGISLALFDILIKTTEVVSVLGRVQFCSCIRSRWMKYRRVFGLRRRGDGQRITRCPGTFDSCGFVLRGFFDLCHMANELYLEEISLEMYTDVISWHQRSYSFRHVASSCLLCRTARLRTSNFVRSINIALTTKVLNFDNKGPLRGYLPCETPPIGRSQRDPSVLPCR
jgi:hypothetical protein